MPLYKFGSAASPAPPEEPTIDQTNQARTEFEGDRLRGGRALKFPLERDGRGDYSTVVGLTNIEQKIIQVLATDALAGGSSGELAEFPEFGSRLRLLLGRNLDETTRELARVLTEEALILWVPEITILDIDVTLDGADNTAEKAGISIRLVYRPADVVNSREDAELELFKAT